MSGKLVVIVGAGVVGLCCAWYLLKKGHKVVVIERGGPDCDCCSLGNAGYVTPSHVIPLAAPGMVSLGLRMMGNPASPFYVRPRASMELLSWGLKFWRAATPERVLHAGPVLRDLNLQTRACYESLSGELGGFGLEKRGIVNLCRSEKALHHEIATSQAAKRLGLQAEVLDAAQCEALNPGVRHSVLGGVFYPQDCHLDPGAFVAALAREVVSAGAEIRWSTGITGWSLSRGGLDCIRTQTGNVDADEYVIAAGSWSTRLACDIGLSLPIQPGKGYSLTIPEPRVKFSVPAILVESRVAVTPLAGRLRFGGTMEIAGFDESINPVRVQGIKNAAPVYFPAIGEKDFTGVEPWRGLRPVSPDGLPYIGRTRACSNLSFATGHAMMGLSLAPVTGKLISEILSGGEPSVDCSLLSPDRYA